MLQRNIPEQANTLYAPERAEQVFNVWGFLTTPLGPALDISYQFLMGGSLL